MLIQSQLRFAQRKPVGGGRIVIKCQHGERAYQCWGVHNATFCDPKSIMCRITIQISSPLLRSHQLQTLLFTNPTNLTPVGSISCDFNNQLLPHHTHRTILRTFLPNVNMYIKEFTNGAWRGEEEGWAIYSCMKLQKRMGTRKISSHQTWMSWNLGFVWLLSSKYLHLPSVPSPSPWTLMYA